MEIKYSPEDYKVIKTEEMDKELHFKLVKFNTGYYGVISHNPTNKNEEVILISPEKDKEDKNNLWSIFGGLGCKSFMVFARDAKKYMKNAPIELVVMLGQEAAEEYREVITRDQAETLYEKVGICHEIMQMKIEDSFHYRYGDTILTIFMCVTILLFIFAIVNSLHLYGVI